jgi:hypothetical protein
MIAELRRLTKALLFAAEGAPQPTAEGRGARALSLIEVLDLVVSSSS